MKNKEYSQLNSHEAIFGFASWLATRHEPITLSGKHNASDIIPLINQFAETNNLPPVGEEWTDYLIGMGK